MKKLLMLALLLLPAASATGQSVRAQLVHNSPDPAVAVVDLYVDSMLTIDDFEFQTATPYMDLPAGMHDISLAPSSSAGANEALVSVGIDLVEGKTYSIIAAGVLDPTQFGPNPLGQSTALTLFSTDDALEAAPRPADIRWRAFLGVIDLPAIDFSVGLHSIFKNLSYGDFSTYEGPSADISVGIATRAGPGTLISSNTRDFAPSVGQALLGMPSGLYGTPERIQWMAVAPDGTVDFGTDSTPLSRAQIVHASPDPGAAMIDVWLDGGMYLNDFAFQTATAYLDLPVGSHEVVIADSSSMSPADAMIAPLRFTMASDQTHSIVLAGVVDTTQWPVNPNGRDISLNLFVTSDALEVSPKPGEWSIRNFYAVPDLPLVDFWVDTWDYLAYESNGFGDFTAYGDSDDVDMLVGSIRPAGSGQLEPALHSTLGSWRNFRGESILWLTTGLLSQQIEVFYVTADGFVGQHKVVTDVEDSSLELPSDFAIGGNYPNPFNPATSIIFDLPDAASVSVQVFDATGRMVMQTKDVSFSAGAGHAVQVNATAWGSGLYLYKVIARARTSSWIGTGRMMLVK